MLPTFEIRSDNEEIRTKRDIIRSLEEKNSRALMQETCWFCQKPTDYDRWQELDYNAEQEADSLDVAYSVPYAKTWEPFFIGRRDMPLFNEKFTMYGYDRMVQVCDM